MTIGARACVLLAAVGGSRLPAQAAAELDLPTLLRRLTDPSWLCRPPEPGERGVQFSSYDRRSDKGPTNAADWYANDDRGKYLRTEERDGRKEYVMCDTDGPGVITRIWSANPGGTLHVDIDGQRVWSVDFGKLCRGQIAPLADPLAGMHAMGGNCYLPIPFAKHVKVTATQGDLYYHVNVMYPPPGTPVASFAPIMLQTYSAEIDRALGRLAPPLPEKGPAWGAETPPEKVPPGTLVGGLRFEYERKRGDRDLGALLRQAELVVRCGDEETVRVPVLDFFACGPDLRPHAGRFLAFDPVGQRAFSYWPMPMPQGGELRIENHAHDELAVFLTALTTSKLTRPDDLLFHASYHLEKAFPSRPFRDFVVLDANGGPGRFVGTALLVKNPHRGWWGEGDEKFYVDGETFPSTFGTGTEDYFGYAWCCPQPFSSALHAQPQCDGPKNYGFTAVHRMHVLDSVPFQQSFHFDLEVWHWVPKLQMDYATVAYWYGAAGARSGLPAVPPPAERTLDRLPPVKQLVVAGALEGEALRVTACSGGKHTVQDLSFVDSAFSRDAQVWWVDGKPGDTLTLAVPVAQAGRYRVKAAFTRAPDYGIVQCRLAGRDLGRPIDLYANTVEPSGALDLGVVELPAGDVDLRLEITGHNDDAEPRHMVGLDYLLLCREV
ncbi:MAG: DUF2961 domain-containing protein [Planctomycetota bacterium]